MNCSLDCQTLQTVHREGCAHGPVLSTAGGHLYTHCTTSKCAPCVPLHVPVHSRSYLPEHLSLYEGFLAPSQRHCIYFVIVVFSHDGGAFFVLAVFCERRKPTPLARPREYVDIETTHATHPTFLVRRHDMERSTVFNFTKLFELNSLPPGVRQ